MQEMSHRITQKGIGIMSIGNAAEQLEMNHVGLGLRKVAQIVKYSDFVDDGSDAKGDLELNKKVPAGSFIIGTKVTVKTGFSGDTSAALSVGASENDDEWSGNTTIDVLSTARNLVAGDGLKAISTAATVFLTIEGGADFSSITAGEMLVEVYYLSTNVELTDWQPTEVSLSA